MVDAFFKKFATRNILNSFIYLILVILFFFFFERIELFKNLTYLLVSVFNVPFYLILLFIKNSVLHIWDFIFYKDYRDGISYFYPIQNLFSHNIITIFKQSDLLYIQDLIFAGAINDMNYCTVLFTNYPVFFLFGFFFLCTTLISLIFLNYLGMYGVFILNFISLTLLWLSLLFYVDLIFSNNIIYYVSLGKWMYLTQNYKVSFDFLIDNVSLSFAFLTLTIAVFVYLFTFSYFRYEPLVDRLILFLNSFIISMVFLVSSGNLIMLFLGWEMIGLTSFFLINFWSSRVGTLKAAFKAYSFNKASDLFLFFAIIIIFNNILSLDILVFNNTIHLYKNHYISFFSLEFPLIDIISFFLLGSAFIKSAQFGAHIWLPDSMEAPVPASALIHSATLVSAGIYLLLRFNLLFELSSYSIVLIGVVGSITALYGGLVSMFQSDVKRVLAYSTISHCGFLMVIYTTGVFEFTILYLYIHGFFKAATFLCVGNVIRFSRNIQDYKRMGGYYKYLPFDCFATFVCLLNLGGLPLTFGFLIKHYLFVGLQISYYTHLFILTNCFLGALTGLFYSSRLFYNVFFDFKKAKKTVYYSASRNNLNSKYYSNTTLAATLAIIGLILSSYFLSLYFFYIYTSTINDSSDMFKLFNFSSNYTLYKPILNNLSNMSIINWVVILFGISIVFTTWRNIFNLNLIYNNFFLMYLFCILFYIVVQVI